ncbi:MAG TPA: hypothetical protein VGE29_11500 [Prosthecobacter sp.]
MGTSAAYSPSPNWGGVTGDVTRALNSGAVTPQKAQQVVAQFVGQLCGHPEEALGKLPSGFSHITPEKATELLLQLTRPFPKIPVSHTTRTSSSGGSGSSGGQGGAAGNTSSGRGRARTSRSSGKTKSISGGGLRPVAQRLASFISDVPKIGIHDALRNAGISDPASIPADKLAMALADVLVGDASLIVESEMRDAVIDVVERICKEPATLEQGESMLVASAYDLENVVQSLFESYIMERFKTFFCEHEAPRHGFEAADRILNDARQFVSAEMELEKDSRSDLTSVDWSGKQGAQIVDAILQRTISIYTQEPEE